MGRAYSDDLRCRVLEAYARGGVSMRAVAIRYEVSFEYVRKIRKQQLRTGQMRRIAQSRYGVRRRVELLSSSRRSMPMTLRQCPGLSRLYLNCTILLLE